MRCLGANGQQKNGRVKIFFPASFRSGPVRRQGYARCSLCGDCGTASLIGASGGFSKAGEGILLLTAASSRMRSLVLTSVEPVVELQGHFGNDASARFLLAPPSLARPLTPRTRTQAVFRVGCWGGPVGLAGSPTVPCSPWPIHEPNHSGGNSSLFRQLADATCVVRHDAAL